MAHTNIFHAPQFPEVYPIHCSHPPNANHPWPCENSILGYNESAQINSSMDTVHIAANYGPNHHQYGRPVSTGGSSFNWISQDQNAPYYYIQHANQTGASIAYPEAERGMAFKRKTPYAHLVYDNNFGYEFAESCSNSLDHPNHVQPNRPLHPNDTFSHYQCGNLSSAGQRYQRNVRSRHNVGWPSSSSSPIYPFHPSANISGPSILGQWHHSSLPGTSGQSVIAGCSNYSVNQSISSSSGGGTTGNSSAYNIVQSRNPSAILPTFHVYANCGIGSVPSSYNRRQDHRTSSSYTNPGIAASAATSFEDAGTSGSVTVPFSRIPWPLELQNTFRNGVRRNSNQAQPFLNVGSAHRRWTSQVPLMDVPSYNDQLELFDEHRDLRLDIDNMSYEELLALEERIGNVNSGLSEDHLTKCLTERLYSSSTSADEDKAGCPICLEVYKDGDNQGILKCYHVYHVTCIKNWLELKNACPICKTTAMDDSVQQKQKAS